MNRPPNPSGPQSKNARLLAQIQEIYALYQSGRFDQALPKVTQLLTKEPKSPHAHTLAAMILAATDQHERALYHATTATKLDPKNTDALTTLASLHAMDKKNEQALVLYEQALQLQPDHPGALSGLGSVQSQLGRYREARGTLKRVQELSPSLPDPLVNRALLELDTTHAHRAIEILEGATGSLREHPAVLDLNALAHSYDDTKSPEQVFEAHQRYGSVVERHIPPTTKHANTKEPDRTLRIGYLSGDLHQHSISYFLEPLLEATDSITLETHIFTTSSYRDEVTERLNAQSDQWHLCSAMTPPQLSQYITAQKIDILVELAGHFAGHKLSVMASTPAPVQVTFIGYGNTTGLSRIDARFVDEITDPAPGADALATESLVRIPGCFLCYRPPNDLPSIRDPDASRPFTLGSFNNLKKLSDTTIGVWARIMMLRPGTRLLIKSSKLANIEFRDELIERFAARGVDASRLDLRAFSPTTADHLDTYNELDLALDTFPYTGTTTTCEALAMGVPVLTLLGETHAGRVSASLLRAAGIEGFTAETEEGYIDAALRCIDAGVRSMPERSALRDQLRSSSLCDAKAYAPKIEHAYRTLWSQWCAT